MASTELGIEVEPEAFALRVADAYGDDPGWLDAFTSALNRQRSANQAEHVFTVWGLNYSEIARMFGLTRQAVSRWVIDGVPTAHVVLFADLAAATDLLTHYVQADRIPAVVRRSAARLDGRSLVDLFGERRGAEILDACRAMFQFAGAHR